MKRMQLIAAALCLVMIATVGTGIVAAKQTDLRQAGASHIYFYDVTPNDTHGKGKLQINVDTQTFVFNGVGGIPGQMYYLSIWFDDGTLGGVAIELGATAADADGSIHMKGQCTATMKQLDEQSPRVFVGPLARGGDYQPIDGLDLQNSGAFVAKIACYYSTDEGVTWHESDHSSDILASEVGSVWISDLHVPNGALVKIHAIVVAGKDRTGSDVYRYQADLSLHKWAMYKISGTTLNPTLAFLEYW